MRPVLFDRTSDCSAVLIQTDRGALRREEISGVENIVLQRLENTAMKLVRSRPSRHGDNAAGRMPVFGGIVVRNDPEFLHRVDRQAGKLLRPCETYRIR